MGRSSFVTTLLLKSGAPGFAEVRCLRKRAAMVLGFGFSSFDARQDGGHSRRHDHGDLSAASVRHASTQYYCSHGSSWFPEIVSTTSPASYFEMVFDQATVLESRVFKPATRV